MENIVKWELNINECAVMNNFNNVSDSDAFGVYPGRHGDNALTITIDENSVPKRTELNLSEYSYSYIGANYFYGIKDNTEIIAILENENTIIEAYQGAGKYTFSTRSNKELYSLTEIRDYRETEIDGYKAVIVRYNSEGECEFTALAQTTYIFKERCISIICEVNVNGISEGLHADSCFIKRSCLNSRNKLQRRVSYDWVYPEDNDFAYKNADALALSEFFGQKAVYTFVRDENSKKQFNIAEMRADLIPLTLKNDTTNIDYKCAMDITIADIKEGVNEAYTALFAGKNMDFAAGVASVDKNDFSTIFIGKDILLNINVTNITDKAIKYAVKYELKDYYNNTITAETFYANLLEPKMSANRNLNLKLENYGMYFLNVFVKSEKGEYRECYHFAVLEDYKFKGLKESPFGICAPHAENKGEREATAVLMEKMGIAITRLGRSDNNEELVEQLARHNVKRICHGFPGNSNPENIEEYKKSLSEFADTWYDKCEYFFLANEFDTKCKNNYDFCKKVIEEKFYPCTFKPAYEVLSEKFSDLSKVSWESNCHASTEWLEAYEEAGLWDASSYIDIHSYSSPSGPDKVFSNQPESMFASLYSNEFAIVRWKRICRRYGKKRMIVGETGYATPPLIKIGVDMRTVADFNTRLAFMFLEAGAEIINYYCLYDRTQYFVGGGFWNEMYFGAVYNYDYAGVYMPKPWAVAYATLTRLMDGVKSCTFNEKYEEDQWGTLRAFDVETQENGKFTAVWSNVYKLPNTTALGRVSHHIRTPLPTWENHWAIGEDRSFDAVGDTVKVVDIMGNTKFYKAENGKVTINITGSPVMIYGIE
ncbi:MAG: hypothetical protein IJO62_00090 [Clostridia bacterium]|nr:hypothetical protein [Clostridia bacterium]